MTLETYTRIVEWYVFGIALTQTVFVVAYGTRRWWKTSAGRAIMTKGFGLMAAFDLAAAAYIFGPDYPGRFYIGIAVFTLIQVGSAYQALVVLSEIFARDTRRRDGDPYP